MSESNSSEIGNDKFQVFIVDDHPIVRQGLTQLIAQEADIEVCGGAENVMEAVSQIQAAPPDLVIVDISLKDSHGLDLIRRISASDTNTKMLVWSMHDEKVYAERALKEGAMGYVNKQAPTETVIEAVRRVLVGEIYLSAEMTCQLLHRVGRGQPPEQSPVGDLSNRELEVFELVGKGMTTRHIARQLDIRPKTVEAHRENIKRKLNVKNSAELNRTAVLWVLEGR